MEMMLVCEGLAYHDSGSVSKLLIDDRCTSSGKIVDSGEVMIAACIDGAQRGWYSFVADLVSPEAIDSSDLGKNRYLVCQPWIHRGISVGARISCRAEKEIGGKLIIDPHLDSLTETPDHDA